MPKARLVVATRAPTQEAFFAEAPTGQSLAAMGLQGVELRLFANNSRGLPAVYNEATREAAGEDVNLVFMHDDVLLLDYFWPDSVELALGAFDVAGIAGNARRLPRQPAWFLAREEEWDSFEHLSGIVGHGSTFPPQNVSVYGQAPREVVLLDGVLLAVNSTVMQDSGLRFDERFDFHFYDLDLCREAEKRGLRMGTWPLSIVHASIGRLGTDSWRRGYDAYLAKWGD